MFRIPSLAALAIAGYAASHASSQWTQQHRPQTNPIPNRNLSQNRIQSYSSSISAISSAEGEEPASHPRHQEDNPERQSRHKHNEAMRDEYGGRETLEELERAVRFYEIGRRE
jgi:Mg-chelatase subunit ChlI